MGAQHTPAPWEVHQGDDYIVVLRGAEATDQGIRFDNIEDARLSAAAPKMARALQAMFISYVGVPGVHPEAINLCREALVGALGEDFLASWEAAR